jgi:Na+/H+ antiporter NhaA
LNENVQKSRRLIASVSLADVRLIELHAKTSVGIGDLTEAMRPRYRHWAKVPAGAKNGSFRVRAHLDLHIDDEAPKKVPFVLIRLEYELEYMIPSDLKVTKAELTAFAEVNGVYNAWPYFREAVQTLTQRMDLPPVILPVYRVPQAAPAKPTKPEAD